MQPTETINASAPAGPASQTEIPDWVTTTPDETEYSLCMLDDGVFPQDVKLTRAEYVKLKVALARLRGFDVPEPEAETVAPEAAKPTNGAPAESTSSRLTARAIDAITGQLRSEAEVLYSKPADDSKERLRQLARNEFQGDVLLLQQIVTDAISGGFFDEFPHESPLVGSVRGNLDL